MENNSKSQATLLWVLAIIITLSSVVYQRQTGPTYPVDGIFDLDGQMISYHFPRSQNTGENAEITLNYEGEPFSAILKWRRYKSHDEWRLTPFTHVGESANAYLPSQPPAGKIMYEVVIGASSQPPVSISEQPIIIRFKGPVPAAVLVPHILFMFAAMFLATRTGLAALVESAQTKRYTFLTGLFLLIGGLILGPIVQKFAFDAYWTGWPFGHDLTDNKTLAAFVAWVLAFWRLSKGEKAKAWVIAAALITFAVYLIPHSVLGSEIDYTQLEQAAE